MAVDAFMWFNGVNGDVTTIAGETTDKYIETNCASLGTVQKPFSVKEYSFDVENISTVGSGTGGAGGGKANFNPLSFTKDVDIASTTLFKCAAVGTHIDECYLVMRKAGGTVATLKPYLCFIFRFVFITGLNWAISGDEPIVESGTFMYGALKIQYWKQNNKGELVGSPIPGMWNRVNNAHNDTPTYE